MERVREGGLERSEVGVCELSDRDRELVTSLTDALVTKTRLESLAGGIT